MLSKIALVGCKGSGKSSVANIFAGNDKFEVKTDIDSCTTKTDIYQNYQNGNIEIFDTQGLNYKDETDVKTFQEMIKNFKKDQLNAIFLVVNGEVCLIDEGLKTIIREICKLFMGKYIWTQIGIIITHYGYKEEQQNKVKQREGDFVKEVLDIAEKEYQEIIRNQDENNKTCDPNEKIVTNLKSFYVNAKRKENGQYDTNTLEEIEKIKQLVKDYPPINKVQSKFIVKKEILKDQKGETSKKYKIEKDKSVVAKLKTAGCYTLGAFTAIATPYYFFAGGVYKLIGLPFNENSFINRLGNSLIEAPKLTPMLFNEIPENMNKKITGSETHYDIFDVEKIYWSDESITQTVFNVRHQIISN